MALCEVTATERANNGCPGCHCGIVISLRHQICTRFVLSEDNDIGKQSLSSRHRPLRQEYSYIILSSSSVLNNLGHSSHKTAIAATSTNSVSYYTSWVKTHERLKKKTKKTHTNKQTRNKPFRFELDNILSVNSTKQLPNCLHIGIKLQRNGCRRRKQSKDSKSCFKTYIVVACSARRGLFIIY